MTIRAVLSGGMIRPLDTLPESWAEGQALRIEEAEWATSPEAISAWAREIDEAASRIPREDHERFLAALAEQERESKELMRRRMSSD